MRSRRELACLVLILMGLAHLLANRLNAETVLPVPKRVTGKSYNSVTPAGDSYPLAAPDGKPGEARSISPKFSPDGRWLAYKTFATNLGWSDANQHSDIVLYDLTRKTNRLITWNQAGEVTANSASGEYFFSPDSRYLAFTSFSSDLNASGEPVVGRNVYIVQLQGPDVDHDGMDDSWEQAYFSSLDKDGFSDSDHDGMSDLAEYQAGTNPINNESVLLVFISRSALDGSAHLHWKSIPGRTYRLQYKDQVSSTPWRDWPRVVTAQSEQTTLIDAEDVPNRYYRVMQVR